MKECVLTPFDSGKSGIAVEVYDLSTIPRFLMRTSVMSFGDISLVRYATCLIEVVREGLEIKVVTLVKATVTLTAMVHK